MKFGFIDNNWQRNSQTKVVHISHLDRGETINRHLYIKYCLKRLVFPLQEQKLKCCTKNA